MDVTPHGKGHGVGGGALHLPLHGQCSSLCFVPRTVVSACNSAINTPHPCSCRTSLLTEGKDDRQINPCAMEKKIVLCEKKEGLLVYTRCREKTALEPTTCDPGSGSGPCSLVMTVSLAEGTAGAEALSSSVPAGTVWLQGSEKGEIWGSAVTLYGALATGCMWFSLCVGGRLCRGCRQSNIIQRTHCQGHLAHGTTTACWGQGQRQERKRGDL